MSTLKTTQIAHPSSVSNNIVLNSDGSATIADLTATTIQGTIQSGTAVASTSGTSIDFTGIPSWVKRITVMFNGVSTNGTSVPIIQLGDSGGIETSGYVGASTDYAGYASQTAGIPVTRNMGAANVLNGFMSIVIVNPSTNTWVANGNTGDTASGQAVWSSTGNKSLSDTLTQVRITTVNGTDTFDAGTINILYEG